MSKSAKSKNHGRTISRPNTTDGPLDIIGAKDTRYPELCYVRKGLKGNGPVPPNPYGHCIPTPKEKNK